MTAWACLGLYRTDCVWDLCGNVGDKVHPSGSHSIFFLLLFAHSCRSWTGWCRPPGGPLWWLVSATGLERGSEYCMADSAVIVGFSFLSPNARHSSQTRVWFLSDRKNGEQNTQETGWTAFSYAHWIYSMYAHSLNLLCMSRTFYFEYFDSRNWLTVCLKFFLVCIILSRSCWDRPRTCYTSTLISSWDKHITQFCPFSSLQLLLNPYIQYKLLLWWKRPIWTTVSRFPELIKAKANTFLKLLSGGEVHVCHGLSVFAFLLRRGFIMGVWNSHTSVGNILGSLIAGVYVSSAWGMSFIVPGLIIAATGVICFFFLVESKENPKVLVKKFIGLQMFCELFSSAVTFPGGLVLSLSFRTWGCQLLSSSAQRE